MSNDLKTSANHSQIKSKPKKKKKNYGKHQTCETKCLTCWSDFFYR